MEKDFNTTPLIMCKASSSTKEGKKKKSTLKMYRQVKTMFPHSIRGDERRKKKEKSRRFNFEFNSVIKQDDTSTRTRTIKRFTYTARFQKSFLLYIYINIYFNGRLGDFSLILRYFLQKLNDFLFPKYTPLKRSEERETARKNDATTIIIKSA